MQLEASWLRHLQSEFEQDYMRQLAEFLRQERLAGKQIYPAEGDLFQAFEHTPLPAVKVVILGQDPYHGAGQAHGLCFSVKPGVKTPPSLQNIYKEIQAELGHPIPEHGCLSTWAQQGVLLLNSVLSVEQGLAASHQGRGWERFTDRVIEVINDQRQAVVFLLWGSYAQRKGAAIDQTKHCVLKAPHPSPLSAHRGFFGCGHFTAANDYLRQQGLSPIDWRVPELQRQLLD
ncbi:uracil-DNA glycosylase [Parahaliea sp. F7430]|uniref:Uracil-DNA glycosylase n=1 Tax=Sediminihaliea albiluteola TaxID=2758564 RepID=A0A7W2YJQ2_9GAMM|nr:uracil-DNA glycosylase [Sediminihaliea albiluteola]MBA6412548.1 uracil-DNA glycosylase [Sediminihaliea albiluteola]